MSIQLRFALLTAAVTAALLLGLAVQEYGDRREAEQIHQSLELERERLIDNLLKTTGERLEVFVGDYAPWDDMMAFVSSGDLDWARTNIDEPIKTQKIDATWVLRPDHTPVHATYREGAEGIGRLPLPPEALTRVASGVAETHFFAATPAGVLEMRCAPIRPSDQSIKVAAASGWLLAGQLWNADYLARLALLAGGDVSLRAAGAGAAEPAVDPLTVVNRRTLRDWSGRPLAGVRFSYTPVMLERMEISNRTSWLVFAGFGAVALAGYFIAIRRWVLLPIRCLGQGLARRDPAPLEAMHAGREFGALAALVRASFAHEQTLRQVFAAFNAIDDAVFITGAADGRITGVNQGALRLLGADREELLGRTLDELQFGPARPAPSSPGASRPPFAVHELRHRDGRRLEVEFSGAPAPAEGEPHLRVVVARDVTARRRAEQLRLRAQRMESIGTLAGGVAHDLNNMLTPISLLLDQLQETRELPSPAMIAGVRSSVRRSAAMLRQLLAFGRGLEGQRHPLSLAPLVEDIGRIVDSTFPKSIRFHADVAAGLWCVTGDATQLHQVLLNLCVNARDALPGGGSLRLRVANLVLEGTAAAEWAELPPGRYVVVEVSDDGVGIAPEHLERIFEPFFTTKDVDKGTGLGLSTTLTIVRSHRGAIRVESTPGQGATFRVALPARDAPAAGTPAVAAPAFHGGGRTVLVVEDEAPVRSFITAVLPRFSLRVLVAENGDAGRELFRRHAGEISLLMTDLQMPLCDGLELIRGVRDQAPDLPVIAMSGRIEDPARAELDRVGAVILGKPFELPDLVAALRRALP